MSPVVAYVSASEADFEQLQALRLAAMRESLQRLGRFDEARSRARFRESFEPQHTRHIIVDGERVGFVAVKPHAGGLLLDHLYLCVGAQRRGIGAAVLAGLIADAEERAVPLFVSALRDSDSNRFYQRHGFVVASETEWDIHYRREPGGPDAQPGTV